MSFKGKHLGIMLAGCMLAGAVQAQGTQGAQYANVQLAVANVDGFSDGAALVGTYGVYLPQVNPNFSVEGEFTTTVSNPNTDAFGNKLEVSYYTLAAYAVYTQPLTPSLSVYGRAGMLYEDITADYYVPFLGKVSSSATDTGLSFGVGGNFKVSNNMDITAGLTVIESDINHLGAGLRFNF